MHTTNRRGAVGAALLALSSLACGDDTETGTLSVLLEAEDTITDGLDPGDEGESIQDGWQVRFDRYLLAIGDIDLHFSTDESVEARAEEIFIVDLVSVPASGLPLWTIDGLRAGRWDFFYSFSGGAHQATRHESADTQSFDAMVAGDLTYLIEGRLAKSDGISCPPAALATPGAAVATGQNAAGDACYANPEVSFSFGVSAETFIGPCEIDGVPGVSIAAGSTQVVAATVHGDHLFFNGFPEGDEGGIVRLAQWLADCDLNLDGLVTQQELESIRPAQLAELDPEIYDLGGSPISPVEDMWTYVRAQLKTQGHMDGEGECPADGVAHED